MKTMITTSQYIHGSYSISPSHLLMATHGSVSSISSKLPFTVGIKTHFTTLSRKSSHLPLTRVTSFRSNFRGEDEYARDLGVYILTTHANLFPSYH
jgi:hypothetical protein